MGPIDELNCRGRVWLRGVLSKAEIAELANLSDVGEKPGMRLGFTKELSSLLGPKSSIGAAIGEFGFDTTPVRLVAFNKTDTANWSVPWHQDRVVAVAQKKDVSGYSNWVAKPGFWHCEAPESLLKEMVFVRVHIDESTSENGPLELAIGSHRHGRISAPDASAVANGCNIESCEAAAGDILIVHALTLHRSASAATPTARRALRVDFARRASLSPQLQWAINVSSSV